MQHRKVRKELRYILQCILVVLSISLSCVLAARSSELKAAKQDQVNMSEQLVTATHRIDALEEALASVRQPATVSVEPIHRTMPVYDPVAADVAENYDLLVRVIIAEAGNQGYDGMRAVAQVIYCRAYNADGAFGDGIYGVLTASGQFASPVKGSITDWGDVPDEAILAVFFEHDCYYDCDVFYFYRADKIAQETLNWFETKPYVGTLGAHTFRGM